jgi:hypothetical protein
MVVFHTGGVYAGTLDADGVIRQRRDTLTAWKCFSALLSLTCSARLLRYKMLCSMVRMPRHFLLCVRYSQMQAELLRFWRAWNSLSIFVQCARCHRFRRFSRTKACQGCKQRFCKFVCVEEAKRLSREDGVESDSGSDEDLVTCFYDDELGFCAQCAQVD